MVEKRLTSLFHLVYYILKLNFFFSIFTLLGFVIFGFGPSLMALISVHKEANFQYTLVSFRRYFESFKENYRFSMQLTLFYGAGFLLLYYSLFISTQMRGILYLMINFLLIALLLFFVVAYFNAMILYQNYDVKFLDLVKLSFILIFLVPKKTLGIVSLSALPIVVSVIYPAFIFFLFSTVVVVYLLL